MRDDCLITGDMRNERNGIFEYVPQKESQQFNIMLMLSDVTPSDMSEEMSDRMRNKRLEELKSVRIQNVIICHGIPESLAGDHLKWNHMQWGAMVVFLFFVSVFICSHSHAISTQDNFDDLGCYKLACACLAQECSFLLFLCRLLSLCSLGGPQSFSLVLEVEVCWMKPSIRLPHWPMVMPMQRFWFWPLLCTAMWPSMPLSRNAGS